MRRRAPLECILVCNLLVLVLLLVPGLLQRLRLVAPFADWRTFCVLLRDQVHLDVYFGLRAVFCLCLRYDLYISIMASTPCNSRPSRPPRSPCL